MVEIKNVIKSLHLVSGAKNKSNSFFYLFAAPREKAGGGGEPLSSSMIDK